VRAVTCRVKILSRISVPGISMVSICRRLSSSSCSGKMFSWTLPHEQSCYKHFYSTRPQLALLKVCLAATDESGQRRVRCWLPFCAFFAAILWGHGSRFIFYGSRFIFSQNRTRWCAASSEAFALYVIVAGCGRAPKAFPKRARKRACSRIVRIM
jgi:hypothetical protein